MYTQTYGLQTPPFSRALSAADVLLTPSLKELQARLGQVVRERRPSPNSAPSPRIATIYRGR